jgi:CRP-like cAMP-binding protein
VLKPREFLGLEECFIGERQINLCYARALVPSELLFFPHERFVQFLKGCASCLFEVCGLLSQRVADLDEKVTRATAEGPMSNLADLLLSSRQAEGGRGRVALWGLEPSRPLLAAILGISEQTVLKLLRRLRRERVISTSDERVEILDERALERLALVVERGSTQVVSP